ncbi:MAG: leucine-rich repeat protein [Oscillospiraceae bacterium]|nr:leucine-rich repeat protein [Oscillospiraceae bacterium]
MQVTKIGPSAFTGKTGITYVTIPGGITSIGDWAFSWCKSLEVINIPNSVTYIGSYAFFRCESLKNINIPGNVSHIGSSAFSECVSLVNLNLPNSVRSIGAQAFARCKSLERIILPAGITHIGDGAFYDSGLRNIVVPPGVTNIGAYTFANCEKLTGVTLPNTITGIGERAFANCKSLSGINIPGSVRLIDDFAFSGCSALTGIVIPDSVTNLGEQVFGGCTSLRDVTLSKNIKEIRAYTFFRCINLERITIPDNVTEIGKWAFAHCEKMRGIIIPGSAINIQENVFRGCRELSTVFFTGSRPEIIGGEHRNLFEDCHEELTLYFPDFDRSWDIVYESWFRYKAAFVKYPEAIIITATAERGGRITGSGTFKYNDRAVITAVPDAGYHFDSWYENGAKISEVNPFITNATENRTLEATFRLLPPPPEFEIKTSSGTGGRATGSGYYDEGKTVTLNAVPSKGYVFDGWYEGGQKINGSEAVYSFISAKNRTLQARFRVIRVSSVRLNRSSLRLRLRKNKTFQLKETVNPAGARDKRVTWKSSKPRVVSVSSKGRLTARRKGSANITVTTRDGRKRRVCKVRVI